MKALYKFVGIIWQVAFFSFVGLLLYSINGGDLPELAQRYVSGFLNFIQSFLSSSWFFVFFVVGWFAVSYALSRESGWQKLARRYSQDERDDPATSFSTGSGYLGKVRYNGVLRLSASQQGLFLRALLPFKFGHKNLLIPWNEITSITTVDGLYSDKTPNFLKSTLNMFGKSEYLNIQLHFAHEHRITVQASKDIHSFVPDNLLSKNS